jgi:plastocyanin
VYNIFHSRAHFTDADKANVFWGKDEIVPGQSVTDTFTAPSDPGDYQIVCGIAGHFEGSMVAKLIVVSNK